MRAVDAQFVLALAVAVNVHAGCAGNPAPREWRPTAAAAQQSSRGGGFASRPWMRLARSRLAGPSWRVS